MDIAHKIGIDWTVNSGAALNSLKKIEHSLSSLKTVAMTVLGGTIAREMASLGKELATMSIRTGISVENLQGLKNVFVSAGAGAKGFQQAINGISRGLLGLHRGEGRLASVLAPMGINPFGKDAKQILLEASDWASGQVAMGRNQNQVMDYLMTALGVDDKTALAMLGGSVSLLKKEARLKEKIGTISGENNKNLTEFKTALDEMSESWKVAAGNIIGTIAPALTAMANFVGAIGKFATDHPVIASTVATLWLLPKTFGLIGGAVSAILGPFGKLTTILTGWRFFKGVGWERLYKVPLLGDIFGNLLGKGGGSLLKGAGSLLKGVGGSLLSGAGSILKGVGIFLKGFSIPTLLISIIGEAFRESFNFFSSGEKGFLIRIFENFWEWLIDLLPDSITRFFSNRKSMEEIRAEMEQNGMIMPDASQAVTNNTRQSVVNIEQTNNYNGTESIGEVPIYIEESNGKLVEMVRGS